MAIHVDKQPNGLLAPIMRKIGEADTRMRDASIRNLLNQHREITHVPIYGFAFRGKVYSCTDMKNETRSYQGAWPALHKSLWDQAKRLIDQNDSFLLEMNQVRMHMSNCILQDYKMQRIPAVEHIRNCVHDGMASLSPLLSTIPRSQEMVEVLDIANYSDFLAMEEKLDFYSAYPLMV